MFSNYCSCCSKDNNDNPFAGIVIALYIFLVWFAWHTVFHIAYYYRFGYSNRYNCVVLNGKCCTPSQSAGPGFGYTVFFQDLVTPSFQGAASGSLARSCLGWVFGNFQHFFFLLNININFKLCRYAHYTNQWKPVLLTVINTSRSGSFWAKQDKAYGTRPGKTSCCVSQTS